MASKNNKKIFQLKTNPHILLLYFLVPPASQLPTATLVHVVSAIHSAGTKESTEPLCMVTSAQE